MESLLRAARQRVYRATLIGGMRAGLGLAMRWLPAGAVVFVVLRLMAWMIDTPAPTLLQAFAVLALWVAVVIGLAMIRAARKGHTVAGQVAERLDLAQLTHNRIATAIALLRLADRSAFAQAAIEDGYECLARLHDEKPEVSSVPVAWRRVGVLLTLALSLLFAGGVLQPGGLQSEDDESLQLVRADKPLFALGEAVYGPAREAKEHLARPTDPASSVRPDRHPKSESSKASTERASESPAMNSTQGATARHVQAEARQSQNASSSRSAASGSSSESDPKAHTPQEAKKPRDRRADAQPNPKATPEQSNEGGSINPKGSSGAGSMQTAQNDWSSKVQAKAEGGDDDPTEDEYDETQDPDKQRIGAQPSLKSRVSRLSRDLSLAMSLQEINSQNRGRGGPGGDKKSRGTATMIMGVPVPGFVTGKMLPGATKSTRELIEPTPRANEAAEGFESLNVVALEDPQERYRPQASDGARAKDFLIRYHTEREKKHHDNASTQ